MSGNQTENLTFIIEYDKAVSAIGIFLWITISNIVAVSLLLWSIKHSHKMTVPKILTLTLAIVDLIFGACVCSMQTVAYWISYERAGGYPVCVYRGFSMIFTLLASQLTVVLMSVERFSAINFPFQYQKLFTTKRTICIILCLVLYAGIIASLPVFGINHYGYGIWCDFHFNDKSPEGLGYVNFFIFEGFFCMTVIIICNVSTIFEMCRMARRVKPEVSAEVGTVQQDENKFIFLITGLSFVYIVCTTPYLVRLMCNQLGIWPSLKMDQIAVRINLGNNMANAHMFFLSQLLFSKRCRRKTIKNRESRQATNVTTLPETEHKQSLSHGSKTQQAEKAQNSDNDSFV